jgi:hypothetical protein
MQVGSLVKYKKLQFGGHHIGHKYGMIGVVTDFKVTGSKTYYTVGWINPPNGLEQAQYISIRLEVLCK